MIAYPQNWQIIGKEIKLKEIEFAIRDCLNNFSIGNLSLSGGIDSTLLLYYLKTTKYLTGKKIKCYTIALNKEHPDYIYAQIAAKFFGVELSICLLNKKTEPNNIVKIFYDFLSDQGVTKIIAGDGVDEFTCGYYSHIQDKSEQNYISFIRKLNPEHLIPLNKNSKNVEVFLPYLSPNVVSLLTLIPLYKKTEFDKRKKIIRNLAKNNIPSKIINRHKYGFCDASWIKD